MKPGHTSLDPAFDYVIDGTIERLSNMDDMTVFKCDNTVAQKRMSAAS